MLALADVKTELVEYKDGETVLEGFVALNPTLSSLRPGVLIVHDWDGINAYEQSRAKQLAAMGYVALCVDIYGKGVRPKNMQESSQQAGKYRGDVALFRSRLNAGLRQLRSRINVDSNRIAAIGYCFGGTGVLELARSGADIQGVVSFHGGLSNATPESSKNIKCKVLVCHALNDPVVPRAQFDAFLTELNEAKVDYQVIAYNVDSHAFTAPGPQYRPLADNRSWAAMRAFFDEIFQ